MGVLRNIVNDVDNSSEVQEEIKEALATLVELAEEKANTAEGNIKLDLQTGKTTDDLTVPITKVIQSKTEYRALTSNSGDIIDDISESLGEIFSGSAGILKGLSGIAKTALTAITGAGEGQENQTRFYSVVTEYPAIVRFDFYFWGRNTKCKSIMEKIQTAFACVAYKSAVDISQLDYNTFIALYSKILKNAFGDDEQKLKEMINESKEIYDMFNVKTNAIPVNIDVSRIANAIMDTSVKDIIPSDKRINVPNLITPKIEKITPVSYCGIF
jgi:uncharacterized protein YjaG (DUF416 family)